MTAPGPTDSLGSTNHGAIVGKRTKGLNVSAKLDGLYPPDFAFPEGISHEALVVIDAADKTGHPKVVGYKKTHDDEEVLPFSFLTSVEKHDPRSTQTVTLHDARHLQNRFFEEAKSKSNCSAEVSDQRSNVNDAGDAILYATFFDTHGFVLLEHSTEVKEWNTQFNCSAADFKRDVKDTYAKEVSALVRKFLYPEQWLPSSIKLSDVSEAPAVVLRRPDTSSPKSKGVPYARYVHMDHDLMIERQVRHANAYDSKKVKESGENLRKKYSDPDTVGFQRLNFWRILSPADGPYRGRYPLALLSAQNFTMGKEGAGLRGSFGITGQELRNEAFTGMPIYVPGLRHNQEHVWYYYPDMRRNEVLVFKTSHTMKTDATTDIVENHESPTSSGIVDVATFDNSEHVVNESNNSGTIGKSECTSSRRLKTYAEMTNKAVFHVAATVVEAPARSASDCGRKRKFEDDDAQDRGRGERISCDYRIEVWFKKKA